LSEGVEAMKQKINWIADIDTSKVNVIKVVKAMIANKPGKYILGEGKSNGKPYVVGVYFADTVLSEGIPIQSHIAGYFNQIPN
jgi:hypothetical protein